MSEFGVRKYDDELGRFTSVDADWELYRDLTPYNYAENNPLVLKDPSGFGPGGTLVDYQNKALPPEYGMGAHVVGGSVSGMAMARGIIELARTVITLVGLDNLLSSKVEQKVEEKEQEKTEAEESSSTSHYAPDRELPRDKHGNPKQDPEAVGANTQLGKRQGRKEKYNNAREFDENGNPVKDIEFTDHGRPSNHPDNPHQHRYKPNSTGGTPNRSKEAEPLTVDKPSTPE